MCHNSQQQNEKPLSRCVYTRFFITKTKKFYMSIQEEKDYVACVVAMHNNIRQNLQFVLQKAQPPLSEERVQGLHRLNAHLHKKLDDLHKAAFNAKALDQHKIENLCNIIKLDLKYLFTHLQSPEKIETQNELNKTKALVYERLKEFNALCSTVAKLDKARALEGS
jgi:hypothetical protein